MLRYVRSGASLAMAHRSFCGVLLILVCFGPLYSAVAAFICIAFKLAEYLHWTDPFWHYLPKVAYWVLPKRVFNYFWPPLRAVPAYVVYDPVTRQYVLVVVDKPGPEHFGPNVGHARFERAPRPQSFRNGAGARPSYEEDDEEDYEEEEPAIVCTRCKRKNPDQRRKPSYCGQCSAPYCSAKHITMSWMWTLYILLIISLFLGGHPLLATAASVFGLLDHLYGWIEISQPAANPSVPAPPRRESERERRERERAEPQRAREQAQRVREQEQQRTREEEQDDESDDSGPISFFGGTYFEGRGLPTLADARAKMMRRAERQEEREKAAAAAKQREAAKNEEKGEGSQTCGSRRIETDQSDREEGHYANYSTYRRKGPGAR
ncbi:hypothetical protein EV122DRAFT_209477 [Schizophyllum commune]